MLRNLLSGGLRRNRPAQRRLNPVRRRPIVFESLEDRRMLSAIEFIKNIGTNTNVAGGNGDTSLSITVPSGGVAKGHAIIVELSMDPKEGAVSATDSAGNIYSVDKDVLNKPSGSAGQGVRTVVFSAEGVNALTSGQTITVTYPSVKAKAISAAEFCGIDAINPTNIDLTKSGIGPSSAPVTTSGVAVTSNANDLLIGAVGVQGFLDPDQLLTGGFTPGPSYTALAFTGTPSGNSGNNNVTLFPEYRIVLATGNYQASGTLSTNAGGLWATAMVAYKADAATHFLVTAPASVSGEVPFTVTVAAKDAANNNVPGYTGTIQFTVSNFVTGEIVPVDYTFTTADAGVHTFTNGFTLIGGGLRTIDVVDECGAISGSTVVNVLAPHLAIGQQPTNTVAGAAISPAVTVRVENADNSLRTSSTDTITLSIASGPGTFTGGSSVTVAAVGGIATFNNLHINTAGTYTILATDVTNAAIGTVTTTTFTIVADVAHHLAFVQQPTNTVVGNTISPAVTVQIVDQFNNLTSSTASVGLGITSGTPVSGGPGVLSGGAAVPAVAGVATFSGLSINDVGTSYKLTATSGGLLASDSTAFNITPRTLTVSATGVNKVYDGNNIATVTFSDDRLPGDMFTISYVSASFNNENVGTGKPISVTGISISGPDAANYTLASTTASTTANITARPLTVSATGINKIYDGTTTATVTLSDNRVLGDVLTTSYTTASFADKNVGTGKPVSVSGISISGADAGNYSLVSTTANTTADITQAALTITASNKSKTYGQTVTFDETTPSTDFAVSGLFSGDTVTNVSLASSGAAASATVAGSPYAIVPSAAVGTGLGNYTIGYVNGSLTVNTAPMTITATNQSKTYGQTVNFDTTTPSSDFSVTGLLNSDAVSSVSLASAGAVATATVAGSPYAITVSAAVGTGLGNYTISYVNGSLTVNTAPLTITAANQSKTYGQTVTFDTTTPSSDFSVAGLLNSDTVSSVSLASAGAVATATVAGSPYAIIVSAAVGSGLGNYTISYVNGSLTVNTAPLTITAANRSKTYGQTATFDTTTPSTDFTVSGLLNSDTVASVSLASAGAPATATVAGSPYAITVSSAAGAGLGNYTISYVDGSLTVNAATLTITAANESKSYGQTVIFDGSTPSTDFTVAGLLNSDTVTNVSLASAGATATATVAGSPYVITASAAVGTGLSNYAISYVNGSLTVNTTPLTITAANQTKTYGQTFVFDTTTPSADFSVAGLLNSDAVNSVSLTSAGAASTATVAGSPYSITVSAAVGSGLANYTISYVNGSLTVNTRLLTVTATGINKVYDGNTTATVTLSDDRVAGDVFTDSYTSANFNDPNVGTNKPVTVMGISISGPDAGNYTLASTTAVTTADITFQTVTLSGQKFNDLDGDGVKDGGEPGLSGWTIQLDLDNNGSVDQTATTDGSGNYSFTGIGPGTHKLSEALQAGWLQTFPATPGTYTVTTSSGVNIGGRDFGNFKLVDISGQKFNDLDGDGVKDAGDPGLSGWTIQLDLDNNGSVDQTATTDGSGNYSFTGIGPGTHKLSEVQQFGWTQTFPATPGVHVITTVSGTNVTGDFGNVQFIEVSGQKFNDLDGDGVKDAGEPGLPGWTIQLDLDSNGSIDDTATTDASGNYLFDFVPPGTHKLSEAPQAGWLQTSPTSPGTHTIVAAAVDLTGLDFGNFQLVTISGQKFADLNANGVKDEGETGLSGWTIQLDLDNNGSIDQTATTGAGGTYSFTNIGPGTYKLSEVSQAGWIQTMPAAPGTYSLTTQSGVNIPNRDFGNVQPAEVHGRKFNDIDADGTDDGGTDPGIAGVVIQLVGTNGLGQPVSLTTTTAGPNGTYSFTNVLPGIYTVTEMSTVGFSPTTPPSGTYNITLVSGQNLSGLDFGNHFGGVQFDFNNLGSPTAMGYVPVPSYYTYNATSGYGWQTSPPQSGFDRGGPDDFRRDGHFGSADNTFQVLLPGGLYRVDLVMGDNQFARDNMSVYAEGNLVAPNFSTAAGSFAYPSFVLNVTDGKLDVRFHDTFADGAGGDPFWVINALKIQALNPSAHTITPPGGVLSADGVSIDTFIGTGATASSLVTVTTDYGTLVTPDADPFYVGLQVQADVNGNFSFNLRRGTAAATAHLATYEVIGPNSGSTTQAYAIFDHRIFDFNNNSSPTDVGAFGVASYQVYSSTLGYGWVTAPPQSGFDRGTPNALLRDGHYGSADNTFRIQVSPGADYVVTLYFRDTFSRDQITISAEGTQVLSGISVPANTTVTKSFTVASADGLLDVLFHDNGGDPFWIINAIEVNLQPVSTKFFVVDATADNTFEYSASGSSLTNSLLTAANADSRGAAANISGTRVWVVDSNQKVYVYNGDGVLQGSWTASGLSQPEGITTNGTDIWIVDNGLDQVLKYTGAATRLSGSQAAASNFSLTAGNTSPKDLVTNGTSLWVVDDGSDKIYKYTLAGASVSSWDLAGANGSATGITLDPSGASTSIWTVDAGTDAIYEYTNALVDAGGVLGATYALAAANTNPQGIADPPPPSLADVGLDFASIAVGIANSLDIDSAGDSARIVDQVMASGVAGSSVNRPARLIDRLFETDDLWPAETDDPQSQSQPRDSEDLLEDPAALLAEALLAESK